jgi:hypothetical protein
VAVSITSPIVLTPHMGALADIYAIVIPLLAVLI